MKLLVLIPRESSSNKQHWSKSKETHALNPDQPLLKILDKSVLYLELTLSHLQIG